MTQPLTALQTLFWQKCSRGFVGVLLGIVNPQQLSNTIKLPIDPKSRSSPRLAFTLSISFGCMQRESFGFMQRGIYIFKDRADRA